MDKSPLKKCKCCLEEVGLLNLWDDYKCYGESIVYGDMIKECFSIPLQLSSDRNAVMLTQYCLAAEMHLGGTHLDSILCKGAFHQLKKPVKNQQEFICESCVTRLNDAVNFRKEILSSDVFLKALNKGITELQIKQDESDVEIRTEYLDIEYLLDDDCKDIRDAVFSDDDDTVEIVTQKRKKRKMCNYMHKDLVSCVKNVQDKHIPIEEAAEAFGVPAHKVTDELDKISKQSQPKVDRRARRILSDPTGEHTQEQYLLNFISEYSNATPIKGHNGRAYECYFCQAKYEDPADLKRHTRKEHRRAKLQASKVFTAGARIDVTDLSCVICDAQLKLVTDLSEHLKAEHRMKFSDAAVNYLIPFRFDGEDLKCAVCMEGFPYFKLLYEHMRKHFRNYECDLCGVCFITRRTLRGHVRRHDDGVHKCSVCPKTFLTRTRAVEHQKQVHLRIKRNKCTYCEEKFMDMAKKKRHEGEVHGAKVTTFQCRACERRFKNQKALQCHVKEYHLMIKNHECDVCGRRFATAMSLREHMVKHTRARDFVCTVCSKGFSRRATLVAHMRIHMGDKRYKCELCAYAAVQKCSLRSHMLSKHSKMEV